MHIYIYICICCSRPIAYLVYFAHMHERGAPGRPLKGLGRSARTVRAMPAAVGPGAARRGAWGEGGPHREGHRRRRGAWGLLRGLGWHGLGNGWV